jgi:parallel beta-helix repeat protein
MGAGSDSSRIFFVVSIFLISIILSGSYVLGDGTGDYPPQGDGDWIIRNDTYIFNESIVLNRTIRVEDNSTLTLENVTVSFNSTRSGDFGIFVDYGSSLNISKSNLTASPGVFTFDVLGDMTMIDSSVSKVTGGIFIQFGDVVIDNCSLYNNPEFAISGFGDPVVTNNKIYSNHGGILTGYGSAPLIMNNTIISNEWGIICNSYGNADIIGNNISDNSLGGISVELGHLDIHNNTISNNGGFGIRSDHAFINATNNSIFGNERWGIYSVGARIVSDNNHFERNGDFNLEGDVLQEWEVLVHVFDEENNTVNNVNITISDQHDNLTWTGNTIGNVRFITLREYESKNNETLIIHTPFTINSTKGSLFNSTTLDISGSEMSIFESQTLFIVLEFEEEDTPRDYEFPLWGLLVVLGILLFVVILILIGIIKASMDRKRRMG